SGHPFSSTIPRRMGIGSRRSVNTSSSDRTRACGSTETIFIGVLRSYESSGGIHSSQNRMSLSWYIVLAAAKRSRARSLWPVRPYRAPRPEWQWAPSGRRPRGSASVSNSNNVVILSAPGVLERLLAVGGLGEQHPHAGLSTQPAQQHRQRRRL